MLSGKKLRTTQRVLRRRHDYLQARLQCDSYARTPPASYARAECNALHDVLAWLEEHAERSQDATG